MVSSRALVERPAATSPRAWATVSLGLRGPLHQRERCGHDVGSCPWDDDATDMGRLAVAVALRRDRDWPATHGTGAGSPPTIAFRGMKMLVEGSVRARP